MSKPKWYQRNMLIWASMVFSILAGISFFFLSDVPFGVLFWGSFYLCLLGILVIALVLSLRLVATSSIFKRISGYSLGALTVAGLAVAAITAVDYRILILNDLSGKLTKEQWIEDLSFLAEEMPEVHPSFSTRISEQTFERAILEARNGIQDWTDNQIVVELTKLVALLDEGHSEIQPMLPPANFRMYPLKAYLFSDGFYITDASRQFRHLIGGRIVRIGSAKIEDVFHIFESIIGTENEYHRKSLFPIWVMMAELLQAEGIIEDADKGTFHIEMSDGKQIQVEIGPEPALPWVYWYLFRPVQNERSPAVSNRRKDNYWFEYWPDSRTIYFQRNVEKNKMIPARKVWNHNHMPLNIHKKYPRRC